MPLFPSLAVRSALGCAWVTARAGDSDANDPAATALIELRTADLAATL